MTGELTRQPPWDAPDVVALPAHFRPQEHWAWARILRGMVANMRFFPGEAFPVGSPEWLAGKDDGAGEESIENAEGKLADWPATRELSNAFMQLILFHEPYLSARSRSYIRIRSAIFHDVLDWEDGVFDGELQFIACRFQKRVNWLRLRVGRLLNINKSRFADCIDADGIRIDGDLLALDVRVLDYADFLGGTVSGQATFVRGHFGKRFSVEATNVTGTLFLGDALFEEEVRLVGARVAGNVVLIGSHVTGRIFGDTVFIGGSLFCREMRRMGDADFTSVRIEGDVQLSSSKIDGLVNFTNARILGEFQTAQDSNSPQWGEGAQLILRNTRVAALAGDLASFRRDNKHLVKMDLVGLHYGRLGGLGGAHVGSLADAKAPQLVAWLEAGYPRKTFTPEPYRQLSGALIDSGRAVTANRILHAMRLHERSCEKGWLRKAMLGLSGMFIGFGHRNDYGFYWFTLLVLGAAALGLVWSGASLTNLLAEGIEPPLRWLGFSLGNAIPLVTLDKAHEMFLADQFANGRAQDVPAVIAWTFYAQKLLGFIILSYLAAGLSGLASRQKE